MTEPTDAPDTAHSQHITDHPFMAPEGMPWGRCQYWYNGGTSEAGVDAGRICGMAQPAHATTREAVAALDDDPGRPASMRQPTDESRGAVAPADRQSEQEDEVPETAEEQVGWAARQEHKKKELLRHEEIMEKEGHKDDSDKVPFFYLPWQALEEVAYVMEFGAKKYAAGNYRKGMSTGRLMSASIRHWVAWWKGENLDPESGLHHLAHSACCVLMCLEMYHVGTARDDRYAYVDTLA